MENTALTDTLTRTLLVSVDLGEPDFEDSLSELRELVQNAGGEVVGVVTQKRPAPEKATMIGSGRLDEIASFCRANSVELIVFDCELSPTQLRNIEEITDVHTIDRTMLILDIFAQRARSSEGKLQVELAQLRYMLPRLTGKGIALSRLGGGIGTRGPGESKLETDRRHIRRRIEALSEKLAEVERRRDIMHACRRKTGVVTGAIVGYTNAGKSTLLNRLTDAGVLAENKLFATLDPTARALTLPSGGEILLVDTVGFIRRLPHHLVKAFRSTLGEAREADVIIHVCDGSDPQLADQLKVSTQLLKELNAGGKPCVIAINKCDIAPAEALPGINGVRISALTGQGIPELLAAIEDASPVKMVRVSLLLPFDRLGEAARVRAGGEVVCEEYTESGLRIDAVVDPVLAAQLAQYALPQ